MKIFNCCYPNLNQNSNQNTSASEHLGEDITNELLIDELPLVLLSTINFNRKLIKIYTQQYSDPSNQLWVRHHSNINNGFAFPLPLHRLYVNNSQASQPLSLVCSSGTALIKFTVVNKI